MEFIFVTGMSGAGKSCAAGALEDLGYYCIDNIPPMLISTFVDFALHSEQNLSKIAIVTDTRSGEAFSSINSVFDELLQKNINYKILFLDTSDSELIRRYSETRRRHPLCEAYNLSISQAVVKERAMLLSIRGRADYVIDTTNIIAGQLKKHLSVIFSKDVNAGFNIICMSFGYKYGPFTEGNLVFDVRCLPNPYYLDNLRELTGLDSEVYNYVMGFETSEEMARRILNLIEYTIPLYKDEGKSQLVIAFGCTGGRHRSVTFAELVYKVLVKKGYNVSVAHRDIEKNKSKNNCR